MFKMVANKNIELGSNNMRSIGHFLIYIQIPHNQAMFTAKQLDQR
jgi:hypothetical protein